MQMEPIPNWLFLLTGLIAPVDLMACISAMHFPLCRELGQQRCASPTKAIHTSTTVCSKIMFAHLVQDYKWMCILLRASWPVFSEIIVRKMGVFFLSATEGELLSETASS